MPILVGGSIPSSFVGGAYKDIYEAVVSMWVATWK